MVHRDSQNLCERPVSIFLLPFRHLLQIQHLIRILLQSHCVFVDEQRLDFLPPAVIGGAEFYDDFGGVGKDIGGFAGVGLEVVKLAVVEEAVAGVSDGAHCVLQLSGFASGPEVVLSPLGINIMFWNQKFFAARKTLSEIRPAEREGR